MCYADVHLIVLWCNGWPDATGLLLNLPSTPICLPGSKRKSYYGRANDCFQKYLIQATDNVYTNKLHPHDRLLS